MEHTYEEIRGVALDILSGREFLGAIPTNYQSLMEAIAKIFDKRAYQGDLSNFNLERRDSRLSEADRELFLEVFWGLFREGIITIGSDDNNRQFPFFRVSQFGGRIITGQHAYFFHDVISYTAAIKKDIQQIDEITLIYLKEAMQAFKTGCILSSSVMLGVATEHTFLLLLETIEKNNNWSKKFSSTSEQRTILNKINKFKNILDQHLKDLPSEIKEDLDTNFMGIISIIRNYRNQSGHPTGKIIDREQAYVLLNLFIPYCKKMYQLIEYYKT